MPHKLTFVKQLAVVDDDRYINDCCIGGDLVLDQLLPSLRITYEDLQSNQEDWGWFAWFEQNRVKLAIDVFTEDAESGEFCIHLTSRVPRLLLGAKVQDTPELEGLKSLVADKLAAWPVAALTISRTDHEYNPPGET